MVVELDLAGSNAGGAVLLAGNRVLITISYGSGMTVIFDPATDSCTVTTPRRILGGYHASGVLLVPGLTGDLVDCRIWDPATDTYAPVPDLNAQPAVGPGAYLGGCVLVGGRVIFAPYHGRDLVSWQPGLGAANGRDIALAAVPEGRGRRWGRSCLGSTRSWATMTASIRCCTTRSNSRKPRPRHRGDPGPLGRS